MSQPVTRGELREELDRKFELLLGAMMDRLDRFRAEMRAEMRAEIRAAIEANNVILRAEIGRDLGAMEEHILAQLAATQEPYKDLPPRVARLEAKVFPPRAARRTRR